MAEEEQQDTQEATPTQDAVAQEAPVVEEGSPSSATDEKTAEPNEAQRGGAQRGGAQRGRGGNRGPRGHQKEDDGIVEKVIHINRSSKVVKGGRRFGFSALVVVGDKEGKVGLGTGKAREVISCITKGTEVARRNMVTVSLNGATLPHEVYSIYDGARVLLRPASPGTGIIAGKIVRAVLESAGVRDVLSKSLGSKNPANVAKAALQALQQLRRREDVMLRRDK
ncbi:MAG: 30S ribosomal protein S5 [Verrucomicrobiota bacterium]|nr:30S ribosomal protein S5 [Verrucomicrobiota bacterium]MEE2813536.1 30S ribosomal protein S5 [Verrucomicrobiota bacterium]